MKKLIILLIILLAVSGCKKNIRKETVVTKTKVRQEKQYYVSVVSIVNHNDYYQFREKELINRLNNNVVNTKEENLVLTTNIEHIQDYEETLKIIESEEIKQDEMITDVCINIIEDEEPLVQAVKEDEKIESSQILEETEPILLEENTTTIIEEVVNHETEELKQEYYSPNGKYLGDTKVKVIDVSEHQRIINWDLFAKESDCYGVILRIGYYQTLDKYFERNISEIKRLNIPYGIYLFSYSSTVSGAIKESNFTNEVINKYNLNPTLGIYYDIESWSTKYSNSNNISKDMYDDIVLTYVSNIKSNIRDAYEVGVYSGRWYAMNRLGNISKSYVNWVAEYNKTCLYDSSYKMWQYTSKGKIPGINGNVDISYLY